MNQALYAHMNNKRKMKKKKTRKRKEKRNMAGGEYCIVPSSFFFKNLF
jgi:hypothetical protein